MYWHLKSNFLKIFILKKCFIAARTIVIVFHGLYCITHYYKVSHTNKYNVSYIMYVLETSSNKLTYKTYQWILLWGEEAMAGGTLPSRISEIGGTFKSFCMNKITFIFCKTFIICGERFNLISIKKTFKII